MQDDDFDDGIELADDELEGDAQSDGDDIEFAVIEIEEDVEDEGPEPVVMRAPKPAPSSAPKLKPAAKPAAQAAKPAVRRAAKPAASAKKASKPANKAAARKGAAKKAAPKKAAAKKAAPKKAAAKKSAPKKAASRVAKRGKVSPALGEALVERGNEGVVATLMGNRGADINEKTFNRAVDRFPKSESVQGAMVGRDKLPIKVAERLVAVVSEKLREQLVVRHELPADIASDLILQDAAAG